MRDYIGRACFQTEVEKAKLDREGILKRYRMSLFRVFLEGQEIGKAAQGTTVAQEVMRQKLVR